MSSGVPVAAELPVVPSSLPSGPFRALVVPPDAFACTWVVRRLLRAGVVGGAPMAVLTVGCRWSASRRGRGGLRRNVVCC